MTKEQANAKREKLFEIIRDLVKWKNTNNEQVLERAREAIRESWRETCEMNKGKPGFDPDTLPAFHDPFAGGGAIPLEAQRLGLEAYASDLNPVAVLINKAMIEIPPKFADQPPVGPEIESDKASRKNSTRDSFEDWAGARGLAEDVRRYGHWIREEAYKRIGDLYPPLEITQEIIENPENPRPDLKKYLGRKLTVIAWLWARTVKSPNPAYRHIYSPLVSNFMLSTKKGKEAYVEPVVEGDSYRFNVKVGKPPNLEMTKAGTTAGKRKAFNCLFSDSPIDYKHIRTEGKAGRMRQQLMAIVCEGDRGRVYVSPTEEMEAISTKCSPEWRPETPLPSNTRDFKTPNYGMTTYGDLFTPRQLVALNSLSDLIGEARERARADAVVAGLSDDLTPLNRNGSGATAYGDAIATYLAVSANKAVDYNSTICGWISGGQTVRNTFGRQAIPMVWDYCESNILSTTTGSFLSGVGQVAKVVDVLPATMHGRAEQAPAQSIDLCGRLISTDPPYYDNIGYADLSDYFYVWLRRALGDFYSNIFLIRYVPQPS